MPSPSTDFRQKVGLFYNTLMNILWNKQKSSFIKYNGKPPKAKFREELSSWAACVSSLLVYALCTTILLQANDIETNPGPANEYISDGLSYLQSLQHHGFVTILSNLQDLHKKMDFLLDGIKQRQEKMDDKIKEQDIILENMESRDHQRNIKFIGVAEDEVDGIPSIDKILRLLNKYSRDSRWKATDISHAYRIGEWKQIHNKTPRPIIVSFRVAEDKSFIMRDRILRQKLKEKEGIKLAAHLTAKQQEEISFYRNQGMTAYFKQGHLYVSDQYGNDPRFNNGKDDYQHLNENYYEEPDLESQNQESAMGKRPFRFGQGKYTPVSTKHKAWERTDENCMNSNLISIQGNEQKKQYPEKSDPYSSEFEKQNQDSFSQTQPSRFGQNNFFSDPTSYKPRDENEENPEQMLLDSYNKNKIHSHGRYTNVHDQYNQSKSKSQIEQQWNWNHQNQTNSDNLGAYAYDQSHTNYPEWQPHTHMTNHRQNEAIEMNSMSKDTDSQSTVPKGFNYSPYTIYPKENELVDCSLISSSTSYYPESFHSGYPKQDTQNEQPPSDPTKAAEYQETKQGKTFGTNKDPILSRKSENNGNINQIKDCFAINSDKTPKDPESKLEWKIHALNPKNTMGPGTNEKTSKMDEKHSHDKYYIDEKGRKEIKLTENQSEPKKMTKPELQHSIHRTANRTLQKSGIIHKIDIYPEVERQQRTLNEMLHTKPNVGHSTLGDGERGHSPQSKSRRSLTTEKEQQEQEFFDTSDQWMVDINEYAASGSTIMDNNANAKAKDDVSSSAQNDQHQLRGTNIENKINQQKKQNTETDNLPKSTDESKNFEMTGKKNKNTTENRMINNTEIDLGAQATLTHDNENPTKKEKHKENIIELENLQNTDINEKAANNKMHITDSIEEARKKEEIMTENQMIQNTKEVTNKMQKDMEENVDETTYLKTENNTQTQSEIKETTILDKDLKEKDSSKIKETGTKPKTPQPTEHQKNDGERRLSITKKTPTTFKKNNDQKEIQKTAQKRLAQPDKGNPVNSKNKSKSNETTDANQPTILQTLRPRKSSIP